MRKREDIEKEIHIVLNAVAMHSEGIGIDRLIGVFNNEIAKRTLQRRLSQLVQSGHLEIIGEGRALRYRKPAEIPEIKKSTLSTEGMAIREYVSRPALQREPVGYRFEFLYGYIPNETEYLPKSIREQMIKIGQPFYKKHPAGTLAKDILNRLLIDLSWASSRLEGNTYDRLDTERLIEHGQVAEGKDIVETQMILNHKSAIEFLVGNADIAGFNSHTIFNLHALLSDGLLPDPNDRGRIRQRIVEISGSVYRPLSMPQNIVEYFNLFIEKVNAIKDPFEQSIFAMVHIPYLQPFVDVNKRTSRLAANIPLIKNNLSPLSFIDMSERDYIDAMLGVYELNRTEMLRDIFVTAYERSCRQYVAVKQELIQPDPFRLRYYKELIAVSQSIIRGGISPTEDNINSVIPQSIIQNDREQFIKLVKNELSTAHEGNSSIYRVGLAEFKSWRQKIHTEENDYAVAKCPSM